LSKKETYLLPKEKRILDILDEMSQLIKKKETHPKSVQDIHKLEKDLDRVKKQVYSNLIPWERVLLARHPNRPRSSDYIHALAAPFLPLSGDRLFQDDPALLAGFASIQGTRCLLLGQEKGRDAKSRSFHNFGMLHPEGFRKARRLMKLAEKFSLPVVTLIDTPGAYSGLEAEERGQAWAIAENLFEMSQLKTPLISIIIGEGSSGGALGIAAGDATAILEHAYYSVISPEGCASILYRDVAAKEIAAGSLKLHGEDLIKQGIVDTIIEEPLGGAHHNPAQAFQGVQDFILAKINELRQLPIEALLEKRYQKYRDIGCFQT